MSAVTTMQGEAARLALAACVGQGAETRDIVELAADVVGEVFALRAKLAESEKRLREVTAQRDAAVKALLGLEEDTDTTWTDCPSCGARLDCDDDEDECASGNCDGDHHCKPDCDLDAARKAVAR